MMDKDYINYVPNGDLIYHSISMIPLLVWLYILYNYVNFSPSLSTAFSFIRNLLRFLLLRFFRGMITLSFLA